eukprot:g4985.t1
MAEGAASQQQCSGSGDEGSLDGSVESMTDQSVLRASDSDSSIASRYTAAGRADSVASTSASVRSKGTRSLTTTSRSKGGSRKVKTKRGRKVSGAPASRTKEETLHLIKLRDDMIEAKHQEVLLLSRQNHGLRGGIDAVEKEMASLHGVIETKDDAVQKLKRESDRLRREIKRLHIEGEEHKGQENAMIVAATQNSRLLKLLEQEELKREDVLSERDDALAQVTELKHRVRTSDERHAKRTSGLEVKLIKAMGENLALKEKYSGTDERIEALEKELESCRKQALFDKETTQSTLSALRQSQYEALSQLQDSRDELQRSKDELETKGEELEVCRQQSAELEMRLGTVQADLGSVERTLSEREVANDEDFRIAQARLSKERSLSESLHNKVASMSRTILRLAERHKELEAEVGKRQAEEARLKDQISQAGQRELRLQQKVVRLKSSLTLEATQKRLHGALDTFNNQMTVKPPPPASSVAGSMPQAVASVDGDSTASGKGEGDALRSRQLLLSKYISLFRIVAASHQDGTPARRQAAEELDVSDCGLGDSDVHGLMEVVRSNPCLAVLDLSTNFIGDAGAASLAGVLRQASCGLKRVDLRNNQMSMEGVRMLAKALEDSGSRGVAHVYVHSEGRIDALGRRREKDARLADGSAGVGQDPLGLFFSVVVVDARDNKPRTGSPNTAALPAASRGKKRLGGLALANSFTDNKKKPSPKPAVDTEYSAIVARQSQVRDFMTKVAYR